MDGGSFDRLTRMLAGGVSRRAGIGVALGSLVAGALNGLPGVSAKNGAARRDEKAPCRNVGSACSNGSECCSGRCLPKSGGTGFRCAKRRSKKKGDNSGGGGSADIAIPTGQACGAGDSCASRDAVCTVYSDDAAPDGTYCTLPLGMACTTDMECTCYHCAVPNGGLDSQGRSGRVGLALACCGQEGIACGNDQECCDGLICTDGACAPPCVSDVCANGCPYTTVEEAYAAKAAGSTIYIGTGTYATQVAITKNMTFDACDGETPVLEPARDSYGPDSYYSIFTEAETAPQSAFAVTIRNLTLQGTSNRDEILVSSYGHGMVNWTIENSTLKSTYAGMYATDHHHVFTDCEISDTDSYGVYIETSGTASTTLTMTGSTISNNLGYGVMPYLNGAPGSGPDVYGATITDCTFTGNTYGPFAFYGTGVEATRSTVVATLTNCTFSENYECDSVYSDGGVVNISGCTFTNNTDQDTAVIYLRDSDGTVHNSTISSNIGGYYGGAIYVWTRSSQVATLNVTGTTSITNNSATEVGGIEVFKGRNTAGPVVNVANTVTISNNTPVNCLNYIQGGAVTEVNCYTWT